MASPQDIRTLFDQALRKHQAGHIGGAEKLYRRILDSQPKHRDSLHLLGVLRLSGGKLKEAISLIEKALALGPDVAAMCFNLARAYEDDGQFEMALQMYDRAQQKDPRDADIYFGMGTVLSALGRNQDALARFEKALALSPKHAKALNNQGIVYKSMDRFDEALASYTAALTIDPKYTDAHLNRANLLETKYQLEEAIESYAQVLSYDPDNVPALFGSGKNYAIQKQHARAIEFLSRALTAQPDHMLALSLLLIERTKRCEWQGFEKMLAQLQRGLAKSNAAVQPLNIARLCDSPELMLKVARTFSTSERQIGRKSFQAEPLENRKLRIGYISSDLHEKHPVFQALAGVLAHHDTARFEIHCFLLPHSNPQPVPDLISEMGDRTHDLNGHTDTEILNRIRSAKLDVAVDLNGFTKLHRVEIFQAGVAPLHVNYLGSPGSMGSADHDYVIGDATLIPTQSFANYAEQIAWMPSSFFPVNTARPIAAERPTRAEAGLPNRGFVFGYFGMVDRILPEVFASWMTILKSVEDSVLWLKVAAGQARQNLLMEANRNSIAPSRIVFAERTESNADHLARLAVMDLCLDTLPYNAHMTALDCLFAGVPVLTLQGKTFAARVASSLLSACSLPELICTTRQSYETTAIELASNKDRLQALRVKLNSARQTSPLFDTVAYTRNLEKAFEMMIDRHMLGLPPQHFIVS